ncbi:unnamed protein product [Dibothriocephalus latus]|uniref:Receptor L-domain domain-containing protein n=1 Tax=Dibothriocephalus latus TaxID=60516 RepID=A0A3P6V3D0_DIBLA|nr:unnamed protein product [Dibothriocephalus latus]
MGFWVTQECPTTILDLSIPNAIEPALNCTIINGNLIITHLSNAQCRAGGLSLRSLVEILGTLTIEHSSCHGDLSFFLPNLVAIHGLSPFTPYVELPGLPDLPPYALLIHHTALSGIGLVCLRVLGHRGALLLDNPQMCYVDTVGWHLLIPSVLTTQNFSSNLTRNGSPHPQPTIAEEKDILMKAGLYELCANACPPGCERAFVDHLPRTFCWSQTHCQSGKPLQYIFLIPSKIVQMRLLILSDKAHVPINYLLVFRYRCSQSVHLNVQPALAAVTSRIQTSAVTRSVWVDATGPLHRIAWFVLFGRHCVTKGACLSMPVPAELLKKPSEYNQQHYVPKRFAIHGNDCVPTCPDGFHRSPSSGVCVPCVGSCTDKSRDCGDIIIYQQSDIANVVGCVTARSVLISLRSGQDDLRSVLADAFSKLRVIHRSLRIIRSDALLSLSFLRHLTDIYGREAPAPDTTSMNPPIHPNMQVFQPLFALFVLLFFCFWFFCFMTNPGVDGPHTALEVTWNGNLEDVWPMSTNHSSTSEKLVIHSGSVEFSVNSKLCPDTIMRFLRERVVLDRELIPSELYLITTSNGEHALFERIAWNDPRQVLPAIISYGRGETQESSFAFEDRTFCDRA